MPVFVNAQSTPLNKDAFDAAKLSKIVIRSDAAITTDIANLTAFNAKIQAINDVSDAEKAAITTKVQTTIAELTTLKTKIDADTDFTIAIVDERAISDFYRVNELIIPQGNIEVSADQVNGIADSLTVLSGKLQTELDQATTTPVNKHKDLLKRLEDMNAKIADAKAKSAAGLAFVTSLLPDQGNVTVLDSNTAALKSGRNTIKVAVKDIQFAREDITAILKGLKISIGDVDPNWPTVNPSVI